MKLKKVFTREKFKPQRHFLKKLSLIFVIVSLFSVIFYFSYRSINSKINNGVSIFTLKSKWKTYDYQAVYDISSAILYKSPFNYTARTYNGYSAFFLAVSQTDVVQSLNYLDEAINSLRIALLGTKFGSVSQIEYMLGKSYFYRDLNSSFHYYADLAIEYLLKAKKHGYKADDIPELLGLSYASMGMTMESISAFTEALLVHESDILLLSIAEQYHAAGQDNASEQYLFRISQDCKDEQIILKSHL
ncbi:hypothetical protein, partial [Treponema sp.]|uniref:hypothetical protein n=1 Tax=Treponema sp. TaxID=166 RepID=UPI00388D500C